VQSELVLVALALVDLPCPEDHPHVLGQQLSGELRRNLALAPGRDRPDVTELELIDQCGSRGDPDSLAALVVDVVVETEIAGVDIAGPPAACALAAPYRPRGESQSAI
jgi:hypothetical protein